MFTFFRKQPPPAPTQERARALTSADLDAIAAMMGQQSSSGVSVGSSSAMQVATVYACVRLLADSIAQLPLKVYRRRSDGGKEILAADPLYALLAHAPNGWMTSFELRELMMACLCLRGNFFAYIERDRRNTIIGLLPLPSGTVTVRQEDDYRLFYDVTVAGKRTAVAADNILHVRGMSLDGLVGVSPIAYQRNAIGLAIATETHGARTFKNGARPGGVLTHPGKLSPESLTHLRESWQAGHGGDKAGGTAILEEGMGYAPVAMTNGDAQYLEARHFQRTEICSIFRVPPHMIGDLTKSSFSNITQQSLEFVKYTILPWSRRIEAAFHRDLLTPQQRQQGVFVELLVDGLERADIKTRYDAYVLGVTNGWLSPNEVRARENLDPREGGDSFLRPLNMTDGSASEPPVDQAKNVLKKASCSCGCGHNHKAIDAEEYSDDPGDEQVLSEEVAGMNGLIDSQRPHLLLLFNRVVRRECDRIERLVADVFGRKNASADFISELEPLLTQIGSEIAEGLAPLLNNYANLVAVEAARVAGGNIAKLTPELDAYVRGYVDIYVEQHTGSTLRQLQALVRSVPEDKAAATVLRRVAEWRETRAGKIADDEVIRFANASARDSWKKMGVTKFRWVNQGSRACPFCRKLNGKIVGSSEPFLADGTVLYANDGKNWMAMKINRRKKHPPIHRKCICAIVPELATFNKVQNPDEFIAKRNGLPEHLRPFLTQYSAAEYHESGAKVFLSETGHAGFAIKGDGELVSVFSLPGLREGNNAAYEAVKHGAKHVWCFDTGLVEFYEKQGFKAVKTIEWDDNYAPEGWDYQQFGKPKVKKMAHVNKDVPNKTSDPVATGGYRKGNLWIEEDGTVKTLMAKMGEMGTPLPLDTPRYQSGTPAFQELAKQYLKECFDFEPEE